MNYSCISMDALNLIQARAECSGSKRRRGEKLGSDAEGRKALLSERQYKSNRFPVFLRGTLLTLS